MERCCAWWVVVVLHLAMLTACGGGQAPSSREPGQPMASASTIATFTGPRNSYTIATTASGYSVSPSSGTGSPTAIPPGTTSLAFSDYTVNIGIGAKAATLAESDLQLLVELYIAFFNRVPDADGLSFWIDQFKAGVPIDTIAENFYSAALQFSSVTGYSSSMTDSDFVRIIYRNVLGRSGATAPPDADVAFWAGELANHHATRGSLIRFMLASAHTFKGDATWGWVADLLDNKFSVGFYFAVQQGLGFTSTSDNVTRGAAIAAAVTSSGTAAARTLVGVNDPSFTLLTLVPSAPTSVAITAGDGTAALTFAAPSFDGGAAVTSYTLTCTGGGATRIATGTGSPVQLTGLVDGTAYSCSARASNSAGTGAATVAVSVTPSAPSGAAISGFFVDAPATGVRYVCSPSNTQGVTDSVGRYTCPSGSIASAFFVDSGNGNLVNLGSATLPALSGLPLLATLLNVNGVAVGLKAAEIMHALNHGSDQSMDLRDISLPAGVVQQINAFIANPNAPPAGFADDDAFLAYVQQQAGDLAFVHRADPLGGGHAFIDDVVLPHLQDAVAGAAGLLPRPAVAANGSTHLTGTMGLSGNGVFATADSLLTFSWAGGGIVDLVVQGDVTKPGNYNVTFSSPGQVATVIVDADVPNTPHIHQVTSASGGGFQGAGTIAVVAGFGGNALTLSLPSIVPPAGCAGNPQFTGTDVGAANPLITMKMHFPCNIQGVAVNLDYTLKLVGAN